MKALCTGFFFLKKISSFYLIYPSSDTSVFSIKIIQFHFLLGSHHQLYKEYLFLQSLWLKMYFLLQPKKNPNLHFSLQIMFLFLHSYMRYPDCLIIGILHHILVSFLTWSEFCPPSTHVPLSALNCSYKLCSETKCKLCSMFDIKGMIQLIDADT